MPAINSGRALRILDRGHGPLLQAGDHFPCPFLAGLVPSREAPEQR